MCPQLLVACVCGMSGYIRHSHLYELTITGYVRLTLLSACTGCQVGCRQACKTAEQAGGPNQKREAA